MLSKDAIKSAALGEVHEVEIKALGGAVRLRELSAAQLSDYVKWQTKYIAEHGRNPTDFDIVCQLGPLVMIDAEGALMFTRAEFETEFAVKKPKATGELALAILKTAQDEPEEREKNLEPTPIALRPTG